MAEVKNNEVFPSNTMIPTMGRNPEDRDDDKVVDIPMPDKVVERPTKTKKRGIFRRMSDNIFAGDRATVRDYVLFDVLLPAAKDTISSMTQNAIDIFLFGAPSYSQSTRSRRAYGGRTDYRAASMQKVRNLASKRASEASYGYTERGFDFDDVLMTKYEAQDVLGEMRERASECNYISLAEYYSLCGHAYDFTMRRYGWDVDDLYHVHIKRGGRDSDGTELYFIPLPRLRRIDE